MTTLSTSVASTAKYRSPRKGCANVRRALITALIPAMLAGCGGLLEPVGLASPGLGGEETSKYEPSREPYRAGAEHFGRGEYGLAESRFQEAVEKSPQNVAAWIALAATYDRLSRFDLADRAYNSAIKLSGETAQILNNQGYSYMLRGNLAAARIKFAKAQALEPQNPYVQNNMKLLESSAKYIKINAR